MSYILEKPYTDEEYNKFKSLYVNILGLDTFENDNAIYALCGNEIVVDGEVVIDENYEHKVFLNAQKQLISSSVCNRNKKLYSGVEYKGVLFDSDTDQKINLSYTISTMQDGDTIVWYGMNNDELLCTKEDLNNIGYLIVQLHTYCWTRNAEIKRAIEQAETLEELEAIDISYDEMDNE